MRPSKHPATPPGFSDWAVADDRAVLGLRELIQLVTVADRRPVALLRILAQQWSLSALGVGSAAHLEALLGTDAPGMPISTRLATGGTRTTAGWPREMTAGIPSCMVPTSG